MLAADYRPEARQLAGSYAQALAALEAEVAKGTLGVGPAAKVARLLRFDLSGDGNPDDVLLSAMQEAGLSTTDPFGAAIISRSN